MSQKIVGYIIVNPISDVLDWDGVIHETKQSAIESLTGPHDPFCNTESEHHDDCTPWWESYNIHPVLEAIERLDQ